MKIAIIGYAGSGKSTLAKALSLHYNAPVLYMDTISFEANWKEKSIEEKRKALREFLDKNPSSWVIDGNYSAIYYEERMEQADQIFFLDFNRIFCYFSALNRSIKYKGKIRESAPTECMEKFSWDFQKWILFDGRKKSSKNRYKEVCEKYRNKVTIFKNRKQVKKYLENLSNS